MTNLITILSCLLLAASGVCAQQLAQSGLRSKAEARIAAIEKRIRSIDKLSAQGLRFKRMDQVIRALESEIKRLNLEIESSTCPEMLTTFQNSQKAWDDFYAIERKHFDHQKDCLGTINLESAHYALISMLSSRCTYLASQLIDLERR